MSSIRLETIRANLAGGFNQLNSDTFQTSAELLKENRTNKVLKEINFYTANVSLYKGEDDKGLLYFGQRPAFNLVIGNNIDGLTKQLIQIGNYKLEKGALEDVKNLESTLKVNISELELKEEYCGWSNFEVHTSSRNQDISKEKNQNYDALNPTQRKFAEAVCGTGNDFVENMKRLNSCGKMVIKIYALKENLVKLYAQESPIVRVGFLSNFYDHTHFFADFYYVGEQDALRGELKKKK